jgi:hypothetical protein
VDVMEFETTEAYSSLDLTKVQCSTCNHSREEYLLAIERVMERVRPKSLVNGAENFKIISED